MSEDSGCPGNDTGNGCRLSTGQRVRPRSSGAGGRTPRPRPRFVFSGHCPRRILRYGYCRRGQRTPPRPGDHSQKSMHVGVYAGDSRHCEGNQPTRPQAHPGVKPQTPTQTRGAGEHIYFIPTEGPFHRGGLEQGELVTCLPDPAGSLSPTRKLHSQPGAPIPGGHRRRDFGSDGYRLRHQGCCTPPVSPQLLSLEHNMGSGDTQWPQEVTRGPGSP